MTSTDVGLLLSKFDCQKGLAHTDLPKLSQRFLAQGGLDYVLEFVKKSNLFWKILTDLPDQYEDRKTGW